MPRHGQEEGGLALDTIAAQDVARHPDVWEKVVRKLRARQMPPIGKPRPDDATYDAVIASLESSLDRAASAHPNPGRTATIRRLTRTEYQNAIRDLLAVEVDVGVAAARRRIQLRLRQRDGRRPVADAARSLRLGGGEDQPRWRSAVRAARPAARRSGFPPDLTQEEHLEGLPIGTRGGAVVPYTFPLDGEYEIQVRLTRDRDEHVEGLSEPHELELLLDRDRVQLFTVKPPQRASRSPRHRAAVARKVDQHLKVRVPVTAGPHVLGVAFPKKPSVLLETPRQPYQTHFNFYRHPRIQPAIYSVSIIGPYAAKGPGDTPSRRRIFVSPAGSLRASDPVDADAPGLPAAGDRRRPQGPARPLSEGAAPTETSRPASRWRVAAVLVSPEFLFRVERDPAGVAAEHALSHQRSGAGVAALVLPVEQHSGRRAARPWRRPDGCTSPRCSSGRSGACWPTAARARW